MDSEDRNDEKSIHDQRSGRSQITKDENKLVMHLSQRSKSDFDKHSLLDVETFEVFFDKALQTFHDEEIPFSFESKGERHYCTCCQKSFYQYEHQHVLSIRRKAKYQSIYEVCYKCCNNSAIGLLDMFLDFEALPLSKKRLKYITLVTDRGYNTQVRSGYHGAITKVLGVISKLHTNPVLIMDEYLVQHFHGLEKLCPDLGNISKLYFVCGNISSRSESPYMETLFPKQQIFGSFVIDIGLIERWDFVREDFSMNSNYVIRPRDEVMIAEDIIQMVKDSTSPEVNFNPNINLNKRVSAKAYEVRFNRDLVHVYNTIKLILLCARKYPDRCKQLTFTCGGGDSDRTKVTTTTAELVPNGWGLVNKDIFNLIFSYISPKDWENTDMKTTIGRITFKNPVWAKKTIERYKISCEKRSKCTSLQEKLDQLEQNQIRYNEEIEKLQKKIEKIPKKKEKAEKEYIEEQSTLNDEKEAFVKDIQLEMQYSQKKKKRPRILKEKKSDVEENEVSQNPSDQKKVKIEK